MKILTSLKQNNHSRDNVCGVQKSAIMRLEAVGKNGTFATEGFTCFCSISEERWSYPLQSNWMTEKTWLIYIKEALE